VTDDGFRIERHGQERSSMTLQRALFTEGMSN
jgi:hypothetical protein